MGLFDAFDSSSGKKAARRGYQEQAKYNALAQGNVTAGKSESLGYHDQGIGVQQPFLQRGQEGIDYYGKLVGLDSGGDPAQMQQTLEGIPGYQFAREQGVDALNRTANSRGMLASGNNTQDILRFSQGLADQNYFNYLNTLQPYFGMGQQAAGNIQTGYTNKAGTATGAATQLAGLNQQMGQAGYDKYANINNAQQAANQNMWNAILGVAGGVTGAAGNAGGFGKLFG